MSLKNLNCFKNTNLFGAPVAQKPKKAKKAEPKKEEAPKQEAKSVEEIRAELKAKQSGS